MRTIKTENITIADFQQIPDNPAQRDTAYHGEKAARGHLATASPTHASVAIAELKDGTRYVLDGHTRRYLHAEGKLELPDPLLATVYPVDTEAEAIELYNLFDNTHAGKSVGDQFQSAARLNGVTLTSPALRSGGGLETACRTALGIVRGRNTAVPKSDINLVDLVAEFKKPLQLLDDIGFGTKGKLIPPYTVAALAALHRDGAQAANFITLVKDNAGVKRGDEQDAISVVAEYAKSSEYLTFKSGNRPANAKKARPTAVFLNAYDAWAADPNVAWFTRYPVNTGILSKFYTNK